ncbi:MAG: carboxypeptidase-like regulatory domain-containing protein [Gemmatales bacterium]|nr:carboxypeptidase-like regulatory domain-containing protein [Gemmatales bacterium]MDW8385697.1 carboxypeptidase-like regulatory domain-containing protein [Gemmatales bacterium]
MTRCRVALSMVFVLSSALLLAAGCGPRGGVGGKPVPSGGTVTLDGQPVEGVIITFVPTGAGQPASGVSGPDGSFRLTTRNTGDGAIPGTYKVTVKRQATAAGGPSESPKDPADMIKAMEKMAKGGAPKPTGPAIHPNYESVEKTPLTWEIPSGGDRNIKLELNKSGT